jgi:hypothetical protein
MKTSIISILLFLLILPVFGIEPIKILFIDSSSSSDIQGQRLAQAIRTIISNTNEFEVCTKLDKNVFVLSMETTDPILQDDYQGLTTTFYSALHFSFSDYLIWADGFLNSCGREHIQETAEVIIDRTHKSIETFYKRYPEFKTNKEGYK